MTTVYREAEKEKRLCRGEIFVLVKRGRKNLLRIATVQQASHKKQCESTRTMKKLFTKRESNLMSFVLCNRTIFYLLLFLVFAQECFPQTVVEEGADLILRCPINESQNGDLFDGRHVATLLVYTVCARDCDRGCA